MSGAVFKVLRHQDFQQVLRTGDSARSSVDMPARFAVGEMVKTRKFHPQGHTRLPRYARACTGMVVMDHGVFIFPDTHAATGDDKPQHCYAVRFTMSELWGAGASPHDTVTMDLFDDYLESTTTG